MTIGIMAFMGILITYVETMITPAIPILETFFNTNYDALSWIITAYIISGTISAAIFGRLADIYGKKKIFIILALIYAIAVSFGGFATTLVEFIAIRAVQGLGMGMFPVAFALLNDQVPKEDLPLAQGILSSTFTGGAAIGLVLGAWITQNYTWQWSYHSAIPVAFGLLIVSAIVLKDTSVRVKEKVDFAGVASLGVGVVALILGLSEGEYWGWESLRILGLFALSVVALVLFVFVEMHS
ncbi:MAG: MFS transporter, partial [Candidatus Thermoplasmatota archaeon]|nr:MFS transporter [Candidatus Thermoplasmatota archaeon]